MLMTTVHDGSQNQSSKSSRVAKLTISSGEPSESIKQTKQISNSIKTKSISIPNKFSGQSVSSVNANLKISKMNKSTRLRNDYFLNSSKSYISQRSLNNTNCNQTSDSEDLSSKIEVKSESLENTIVPILIVSSKNKLKSKHSDHFDQKTRAKYINTQRVKNKQIATATGTATINTNDSLDQAQLLSNKINHYINQV